MTEPDTAIQEADLMPRAPTHEEAELLAWFDENKRKEVQIVQDSLKQLVTLTTALLAGSAAFLTQAPVAPWIKGATTILLLASLTLSLWGSLPYESTFRADELEGMRAFRADGNAFRSRCLYWSARLLLAAFVPAIIGLLF